jgi:hypothetical protein
MCNPMTNGQNQLLLLSQCFSSVQNEIVQNERKKLNIFRRNRCMMHAITSSISVGLLFFGNCEFLTNALKQNFKGKHLPNQSPNV